MCEHLCKRVTFYLDFRWVILLTHSQELINGLKQEQSCRVKKLSNFWPKSPILKMAAIFFSRLGSDSMHTILNLFLPGHTSCTCDKGQIYYQSTDQRQEHTHKEEEHELLKAVFCLFLFKGFSKFIKKNQLKNIFLGQHF